MQSRELTELELSLCKQSEFSKVKLKNHVQKHAIVQQNMLKKMQNLSELTCHCLELSFSNRVCKVCCNQNSQKTNDKVKNMTSIGIYCIDLFLFT